ncbi:MULTISPECIES: universal stress protein [Streptomyces]|uniref:Nucleotide-binding universal stress UspA family protein n=3 Tax=Streptomyces TaxID=1883 RepID=A0AA40SD02_9ACTN|nr:MULTISPECIES: universal stress protein [Streptomyces]MBA8944261.1 nucleotide-binding universal stress UspA family protein [Streptomyces calvus]MBA8976623.1 nucleotide-binding universal stress UspA family protein [Streptomyces calvus]MYS26965.1 universal stress protein [Streptomyces sp. SID7804]GGP54319.1 universal stress protein [Streptomyces calvus]GGS54069.1 universal stress protein [Streptomyces rubiginosus]
MTGADGRRPIVVGVDPDPSKRLALSWAADEADRRGLPLRLVHAQGTPTGGYRSGEVRPSWEEWNRALHGLGDQVLKEAASFVESRRPTVETSTLLAEGEPAWVLHEEARSASLVVVGSWHLSKRRGMFSSASVALPLTAHASCPVVVVPEPEHITQRPAYVVVGVDGSEHAAAAVDVAFEEAALRGALLRALYVWHPPLLGVLDEDAAVRECRRVLSETVAGRAAAHPDVELHHEVVRGHPVQVLTEASRHALGLVVGTRGHGGFTGMVLGSVSQGVLHHAHCPVITVPA